VDHKKTIQSANVTPKGSMVGIMKQETHNKSHGDNKVEELPVHNLIKKRKKRKVMGKIYGADHSELKA
jgi:hypothetical protein